MQILDRKSLMAAEQKPILISPESELGKALKRASVQHEPILVLVGDDSFEVDVFEARIGVEPEGASAPDSVLNIIGIAASAEPSDIARFKDAYLADAYDYRKR